MKRVLIFLCFVTLFALLISCSAICPSETNKTNTSASITPTTTTIVSTSPVTASPKIDANLEMILGEWVISNYYPIVGASKIGDREAQDFIGKSVTYGLTQVIFNNSVVCSDPHYRIELASGWGGDLFSKSYTYGDLNISNKKIQQVTIYEDNQYIEINCSPVSFFFIKDKNTLLLLEDGVYFDMKRP